MAKKYFIFSFFLSLSFGLFFINFSLSTVFAANVNVSAEVPNLNVGPACGDGNVDAGESCDDGNTLTESCGDGSIQNGTYCDAICKNPISLAEECESDADCSGGASCVNCVCGAPACFLGDTDIALAGGVTKNIEDVEVGDVVVSYNETTGRQENRLVTQIFKHQTGGYLIINDEIKVTPNHPFYINGQWQPIGFAKLGDNLLTKDGRIVPIVSIIPQVLEVDVYNLEVGGNHNYYAQDYLAHNKGECIPGDQVCSYGECINNQRSFVCTDGCNVISGTQPCISVACGNGIVEAGEECDDGNLVSGDGCSAICQVEVGCGNGIVEAGEECDDGNLVSGDCCSSTCRRELNITNVLATPTTNSATVSWVVACQVADSTLEWGTNVSVSDGSVSGLTGQNFSYNIIGLQSSTVHYYRITAVAASAQDSVTGSFQTLGAVENCSNGIDDDADGFVDIADPDCPCQAEWLCTPADWDQVPCVNNQKTRSCQKINNCWNDQPLPEETIGCDACAGVTCPPNFQLNPQNCSCQPIPSQCGNGVCEPPLEDPYTCPQDCSVSCLSDWQCTDWQPAVCPPSGIQARDCFDRNACPIPINQPALTRSCGDVCQGLTCGSGQQINLDQCICEDIVPFCGNGVCELTENHDNCPADCVVICTPNWTVTAWSECINGVQTRTVSDLNGCGLDLGKPPVSRSCLAGCELACGTCQYLDVSSCSCLATIPCCGNRVCEEVETNWSCAVDCGIPPDFSLRLSACVDGLDNDQDSLVDFPADPGCESPQDNNELNLTEVIVNIQAFLEEEVFDNPLVEQANEVVAPVVVTAVAVNTFATFSFINFFSYLQFFITQPFAALFRKKRRKWGVVYNALTKQPVDLAIVRLYNKENGRLIQSRVTDKQGRYSFLTEPGRYYLTVTKPKFDFPTQYLKDVKEDVTYLDVYHGEVVEVTTARADITVNIPIDPQVSEKPVFRIIIQHYLRKIQYAAAFTAVPLAAISMVVSPGPLTFSLFGVHCLLYVLFRRLGYERPPKNWGIVYDRATKKPLARAIARIYDKQYNKLLETRVTDNRGRYSFLVNNNVYYVTAEKPGYRKGQTADVNLVSKDRETVIGLDIPLEKGQDLVQPSAPSTPTVVSTESTGYQPETSVQPKIGQSANLSSVSLISKPLAPESSTEPVADQDLAKRVDSLSSGVGRESLEELLKTKRQLDELHEEIDERQEDLDGLEDQVEDIAKTLDQKIESLGQDQTLTQTPTVKPGQVESATKPETPGVSSESPKDKPASKDKPSPSIFG
ncbi:MAG: polymorphic toxin-type HINT domain-containing protein [Patescibacteria group bacterium]|jgi:cysteine-rich repeat protein|nr:polymorphic toxin-type HINT domain-containing protein [Patescibacteria group bacterium]